MDAKYRVVFGEGVETFTDFDEAKKFAEQTNDQNTVIYLQVGTMCGMVWKKENKNE
ncbi:MAG: hypothetical protein J6V44_15000 [Methanobrevibacter sp.]|nr:hypothetical protein [Methanobrevibacter sp.]MBO7692760.1 hypothetical protein [Methanobrevibacter sp.]